MSSSEQRIARRAPVVLRIKLRYKSVDSFIAKFATNISRGGMFISSRKPKAIGTSIRFELRLADSSPLIAGQGVVRWVRQYDPEHPRRPYGMGIQFTKLNKSSTELLGRIVDHKTELGLPVTDDIPLSEHARVRPRASSAPPVKDEPDPDAALFELMEAGVPDLDAVMARAHVLAHGDGASDDLDRDLEQLLRVSNAVSAKSVDDASSQLASLLGGNAVAAHRAPRPVEPETSEQKPEASEPETRNQKPETRSQKPEASEQKPEASEQKPEASEQKPETSEQKPEASPASGEIDAAGVAAVFDALENLELGEPLEPAPNAPPPVAPPPAEDNEDLEEISADAPEISFSAEQMNNVTSSGTIDITDLVEQLDDDMGPTIPPPPPSSPPPTPPPIPGSPVPPISDLEALDADALDPAGLVAHGVDTLTNTRRASMELSQAPLDLASFADPPGTMPGPDASSDEGDLDAMLDALADAGLADETDTDLEDVDVDMSMDDEDDEASTTVRPRTEDEVGLMDQAEDGPAGDGEQGGDEQGGDEQGDGEQNEDDGDEDDEDGKKKGFFGRIFRGNK